MAPCSPVLPPTEFLVSYMWGSCSRWAFAAEPKSQIRGRPRPGDQRPPLALVERPVADLGGGGVADVGGLEQQHRAEVELVEHLPDPGEPVLRRRSKSTRSSQSTPMTPGAGLVATGNSSMACSSLVGVPAVLVGERVLEVGPVAGEAVRVARRGLGRLRLQPPDPALADVAELVDASDAGPGHVAGAEAVGLAVEDALDLALEDQVGLLERMVVRRRRTRPARTGP